MTAIYLKTEEEVEGFKNVCKHAKRILNRIKRYALPGWKPVELDEIARKACEEINAKPAFLGYRGFPAAICVSKNNVMVHGIPDEIVLRKGDLISIDFGLEIDGFIGDIADTFVVGETPGKYGKLIQECKFALYKAIKAAKDGNKLSNISYEIQKVAKKNGFLTPDNYGGHGVDRNKLHAAPFIPNHVNYEYDFILRKGMILAIEPMFIDASSNDVQVTDDKWSVLANGPTAHCEHTVLVDNDEGIALTDSRGWLCKERSMTDKALLITFEGGEGCGKTTQIQLLSKWMEKRNIPHIVTKEPGSPHIEECVKYRELLLNPNNDICATSELMLFLADRAQHVEKFIRPTLEKGMHVLCDRYSDSTRVYQCARGLSRDKVDLLIDFATNGLAPDLTFVLDIPADVGLKRAKANSKYEKGDRMESAGIIFHEDVRHGFLKLAESISEQHRIRIIDTVPPKTTKQISEEIIECVSKKLWIKDWEDGNE